MASGGARRGAGRPKGTKNLRTVAATNLLTEAQSKFPDFNPIAALIALASEPDTDPTLAKECYVAVLPYMAPRFRPVEADIERLVELETRLARAKLEASAQLLHDRPDLADRLDRAAQRALTIVVDTGVSKSPDHPPPAPTIDGLAAALERAETRGRLSPPEKQTPPPERAAAPEKPAAPPPPAPYAPINLPTMSEDYSPFSSED